MSNCNIVLNQEQIKSKVFFPSPGYFGFLKLLVLETHATDTAEKTEGSAISNWIDQKVSSELLDYFSLWLSIYI